MFFGYSRLTRAVQQRLTDSGLGLAHFRALYWIGRHPDLSVSELLAILGVTKQSLGRVLTELEERNLVATRIGDRDRRQRLLKLTEEGLAIDTSLFHAARDIMAAAYSKAGQQAVGGFWAVLEGLLPDDERSKIHEWRDNAVPPGGRG